MRVFLYEKKTTLPKSIKTSVGAIKHSTNYFVEITDGQTSGYGEASSSPLAGSMPIKLSYGSPPDKVKEDIIHILNHLNLSKVSKNTIKSLHKQFPSASSESLAALDMALHDYVAKKKKIPVWKMYTNTKNTNSLLFATLSIENGKDTRSLQHGKLKNLKINVTKENVRDLPLDKHKKHNTILDFNGLYDSFRKFKSDFLHLSSKNSSMVFEEPFSYKALPKRDSEYNFSNIVFDDSFVDAKTFDRITVHPQNVGLNYKIQKLGGIYPCVQMHKKASNRKTIIGCALETSLGVSASAQLSYILKPKNNPLLLDLDSDIHLGFDRNSPKISPSGRVPKIKIGIGYTPDTSMAKLVYARHVNSKNGREYHELAKYYDLLHHDKQYNEEAQLIIKLIEKHKKSSGTKLLNLACGTGNHDGVLSGKFKLTGIDKSPKMIKIAKLKNPEIHYRVGDVTGTRFGGKFDVITMLFNSVGYIHSLSDLNKLFGNSYRHLNKGGVFILDMTFLKGITNKPFTNRRKYADSNISIERIIKAEPLGDFMRLGISYKIDDNPLEKDVHLVRNYSAQEIKEHLRKQGFEVFVKKNTFTGGKYFIATK